MKQFKKWVAFGLMVGLLWGCSRKKEETSASEGVSQAPAQVFYYGNYAEPEYLDPGLASGQAEATPIIQLFEGLTDYHPKTLDSVPAVAERWDVSGDAKTYTFYLRKNAKWSDGSPVTAHDFVYSWQRVVNPETASKYAYILYYVKNGQAINEGKIKDLNQLGVKAIDDTTLKVDLENPTPFFISLTTYYTYRPVKKSVVEKFGRQWTRPENIVTNGYFMLKEWVPNKEIVMVPNPNYWDKDKVYLNKVVMLPIEDHETSLKKFLAGEVHYIHEVPNVRIPSLKDNPEFIHGPYLGTYYVMFNITKPPFDNKLVRQALAHAIDREQLVKVINKGLAHASLTPKGIAGYEPPAGQNFDPAKAKQLLKEAGYESPEKLPKITFFYNTDPNHKMILEIVQSMLKQNLGINVEIQNMEWKVLLKALDSKDFQASRLGWIGDYMDVNTFGDLFTSYSGNNHTAWKNAQYDQLIAKANQTLDKTERYKYFQEAETMLLDESPIVPLFTYTMPAMISKKLEGFYHNLQDMHPLKGVKVVGTNVVQNSN